MRADKFWNAVYTLIVSLVILFFGCSIPMAGTDAAPIKSISGVAAVSQGEKISYDNDVVHQDAADGNVWCSMYSFTRAEQTMRSGRAENSIYFISIFAILFKIAIIPSVFMLSMSGNC